jgi:deazaflavin-dependent oxidoreductase (nitroreductase family)
MELSDTLTDYRLKTMNFVHKTLLTVSGGRLGNEVASMPIVELHTIGRKSGQRRSTMLAAPIADDGRYVLVASKGGDDRNPQWYHNLVAKPEVELTVSGVTTQFIARVATDTEKSELWPEIVATYAGYGKYQSKTDRDIPVVICELPEG